MKLIALIFSILLLTLCVFGSYPSFADITNSAPFTNSPWAGAITNGQPVVTLGNSSNPTTQLNFTGQNGAGQWAFGEMVSTNGFNFTGPISASQFTGNGYSLTNLASTNINGNLIILGNPAIPSPNAYSMVGLGYTDTLFGTSFGVNFNSSVTAVSFIGDGSGLTNVSPKALSAGSTFTGVDIPTNALGTHGYLGYFTNGLFVLTGNY